MNELFEAFSAVPLRILDLRADLAKRFALPRHLDRSQMPELMSWYTCGVVICGTVAVRAPHANSTVPIGSAHDQGQMWMRIHTLSRTITGGMAIQTAGMSDDIGRFIE
jgi:hypothetical protein